MHDVQFGFNKVLIPDLHLRPDRLPEIKECLDYIKGFCDPNSDVVFLGDIFHKPIINWAMAEYFFSFIEELCFEVEVHSIVICIGNPGHDPNRGEAGDIFALLAKMNDNIHIVRSAWGEGEWCYLAYEIDRDWNTIPQARYYAGHFSSEMYIPNDPGNVPLDVITRSNAKWFAGHYHGHMPSNDNITHVGSLYPVSFDETGEKVFYKVSVTGNVEIYTLPTKLMLTWEIGSINQIKNQLDLVKDGIDLTRVNFKLVIDVDLPMDVVRQTCTNLGMKVLIYKENYAKQIKVMTELAKAVENKTDLEAIDIVEMVEMHYQYSKINDDIPMDKFLQKIRALIGEGKDID